MSDPAARNLIDVEFYRTSHEIGQDQPNLGEELIELLITAATDAIEQRCNRKFITPSATIDEIFDGTGDTFYLVKHARINSATTPVLSYWSGTAWTVASTTAYPRAYVDESGEVYFTNGQNFWTGRRNWKITYKYGWTNVAALPFDLKRATADLVKWMRFSSEKQGVSSENFGATSVSYSHSMNKVLSVAWPIQITAILDTYKRVTHA